MLDKGRKEKSKKSRLWLTILAFLGLDPEDYPLPDKQDILGGLLITGLAGLVSAEILKQLVDTVTAPAEEVTEYWILGYGGKSGENCPICIGFADMGGQALGYFPEQRAHTTYCEEYCTCHMEYSDGKDHPEIERYTDWQEWELNRGFAM